MASPTDSPAKATREAAEGGLARGADPLKAGKALRPPHPFAEPPGEFPYAKSREDATLARIAERHDLYIDGRWQSARRGRFPTENPATGEVLSEIALASRADVGRAVAAARRALPRWAGLPGAERARRLFAVARILQERSREFAVLETLDNGKPIRESRDVDVPLAAAHFFYYAGWADKLEYALPGAARPEPVGVCGQIIPWNFPLLMAAWKLAPALACGNTVVLKPAETSSLSALRLVEVLEEAGIPRGVVNIVTGPGEVGAWLVEHEDLDKVAFTGSTEVGKEIQRQLAGRGVRLTLELGGKGAHVIFEDAPIPQAVEGIVQGIFFNQGQVCCAGSRLFVQEGIAEAVLARLKERLQTLRVGDPLDKNTDLGAIHSKPQWEKVRGYLELGRREGARLWQAGGELPAKGYWCRPSVFEEVAPTMRIAKEEIFGPVLAVLTFRTPDEAVRLANDSLYGLSAGVWTEKGSKILRMVDAFRAGVVWANAYNRFDPTSPFGGYKESGFGREGGLHGLFPYLRAGAAGRAR